LIGDFDFFSSIEEPGLRSSAVLRQHRQLAGRLFALQMRQNPLDDSRGATLASSMQRFDASTMILTCPAHRSQVSMGPPPDRSGCGSIEHPFEPLHLYALGVQVIATCWVCTEMDELVCETSAWKGLLALVVIESKRTVGDKTMLEHRFYITSKKASAS
jgi:hypothetical protein